MIPATIAFTGLEFDPSILRDRCIKGVIPLDWQRHQFTLDHNANFPANKLNRWLQANIEGSWALYVGFTDNQRIVTIAFEHEYDAMTFIMADGATQAFKDTYD